VTTAAGCAGRQAMLDLRRQDRINDAVMNCIKDDLDPEDAPRHLIPMIIPFGGWERVTEACERVRGQSLSEPRLLWKRNVGHVAQKLGQVPVDVLRARSGRACAWRENRELLLLRMSPPDVWRVARSDLRQCLL